MKTPKKKTAENFIKDIRRKNEKYVWSIKIFYLEKRKL